MGSAVPETKACIRCSRSKRRCGKQQPTCERCQRGGFACSYPPRKPSSWMILNGDDDQANHHHPEGYKHEAAPSRTFAPRQIQVTPEDSLELEEIATIPSSQPPPPPPPSARPSVPLSDLWSAWFLTPDTWLVQPTPWRTHHDMCSAMRKASPALKRFCRLLQGLASDWVTKGSSGIFHARLYKFRFPRCMQDAHTAISSYLGKTPHTEPIVLRIIGDRITQLVEDESGRREEEDMDAFEHMARVHALIVFSIIGLYDGDIRLRYLAETQSLPLLTVWNRQMLDAAQLAASNGQLLMGSLIDNTHHGSGEQRHENDTRAAPQATPSSMAALGQVEEVLWHAWILAESVRRCWFIAASVGTLYRMLQKGEAQCRGDLKITSLRGVWDAPTAWAWMKMCEQDIGFMPVLEMHRLIDEKRPEEVDEFAMFLLEAAFGSERVEAWGVSVD
ncbi:hypothetical protein B0H63DRAFT_189348 [Podospora didyma]|uniref:Zn(2)-C6 fungal-type domain-containing protein n=1 Tax=Podospora didyma TaxID=330526 RepID=A0AAE0NQY8_9PEZI|nr:hypothetical protein B0H63DRAFT_189348 [Podospora didyma]